MKEPIQITEETQKEFFELLTTMKPLCEKLLTLGGKIGHPNCVVVDCGEFAICVEKRNQTPDVSGN